MLLSLHTLSLKAVYLSTRIEICQHPFQNEQFKLTAYTLETKNEFHKHKLNP